MFFGATVTCANEKGEERTVKIVGVDEVDLAKGHVSWISPIAKALLRAEEGDVVKMRTPARRGRDRDREGRVRLRQLTALPAKVGLSGIPGISGRERGVGSREDLQSIDIDPRIP